MYSLTKLNDFQWTCRPSIQIGELFCVILCLWPVKQWCSWHAVTVLMRWQHLSCVIPLLALYLEMKQKGNTHIGVCNEFRSLPEPGRHDLSQLLYGNRLWMKLLRGLTTAEMSWQWRRTQGDFNCTSPVQETGYSCMGYFCLHASWLRTEILAATAKPYLVPEPGCGVCTIDMPAICVLFCNPAAGNADCVGDSTYCLHFRQMESVG